MNDLRSIRNSAGLTQDDLAQLCGLSQSHIASIESGKLLPQKRTRAKLERLLGSEINWLTTLAQDRDHIGYALNELINTDEPGVSERIHYCRQYLHELSKMISYERI